MTRGDYVRLHFECSLDQTAPGDFGSLQILDLCYIVQRIVTHWKDVLVGMQFLSSKPAPLKVSNV